MKTCHLLNCTMRHCTVKQILVNTIYSLKNHFIHLLLIAFNAFIYFINHSSDATCNSSVKLLI